VITLCPVQDEYRDRTYHRRAVGFSHFAIAVDSVKVVDEMAAHLARQGIPLLGEGKMELGYRRDYYTLAFEDPDRMMIEIVHHDPHYFSLLPP
jgi:catechol 2,3-dioxygenase-like lactoylglutathione lyase family enzyme